MKLHLNIMFLFIQLKCYGVALNNWVFWVIIKFLIQLRSQM